MSHAVPLRARLFVALQYLLPQLLLSGIVGAIARARVRWIRIPLIRAFVRAYRPELQDAEQPDPLAYASFNAFFTRALRPEARPIAAAPDVISSPVDGRVSALGTIDHGRIIQAKGRDYSLLELLAGNAALAERLSGGSFLTAYLAPFNYHRIHMALAGSLVGAWYIPGRLYSVNEATSRLVPGLFARNERVVLEFAGERTAHVLVMVGALFVGSMDTVWHGTVPRLATRLPCSLRVPEGADSFRARGAELGRFNMGSTVILLLPPGCARWHGSLAENSTLRMGEAVGTLAAGQARA